MNQEDLKTVLSALVMSSPHLDALYRWKDPAWLAQRWAAIELLVQAIEPEPCRARQDASPPA